ncbi:hypothetical protein NBRC3257_2384 [Gluconobacter thailandicus NBRC 3257]|uniref:Uncharacterized protein n=1 Tax=Gluconobacter thailandicus NBRC 3257 TaxID=1381097 RepID=A0ABQ0IYU6_GLUTH|nr:hypothetical protein NBRC3255_0755 [Gluconobacter thailandicus NBRC 3255]GAD27385.1 hypothetical protein NBRC3257_2384 [Gluconobacter thailandicus NBRC 3257]
MEASPGGLRGLHNPRVFVSDKNGLSTDEASEVMICARMILDDRG